MRNNERTRSAAAQKYIGNGYTCNCNIAETKNSATIATCIQAIFIDLCFLMRYTYTGISTRAKGFRNSNSQLLSTAGCCENRAMKSNREPPRPCNVINSTSKPQKVFFLRTSHDITINVATNNSNITLNGVILL